jgi:hypothetical protein
MESLDNWNQEYVTTTVRLEDESAMLEKKSSGKFSLTAKGHPDGATKDELAKQVAAFSNSGDGFLVYGIDDDKKTLDAGVPILIGTQPTKDWVEAIIPKLVYPSVSGCEAKMVQVAGHHASGMGVLVIAVPLSEQRPHWVGPNEVPYIRAGAHSIPMRPQTFLDIASRENAAAAEIEGIGPVGNPSFAGSVKTYSIQPFVRLLNGPVSDRWAFEMKVRSGRIKIKYPSNLGAKITSDQHLYLLGNEPLFPGRSTPVSPLPFHVDWDGAVGNNEIEAVLYVSSASPVRRIFTVNDIDQFHAKITGG